MAVSSLSVKLNPPLCERPAKHSAMLSEIVDWRDTARLKSAKLASKKVIDRDGRPSPTLCELTKDLEWYLNDAVDGLWRQQADPNARLSLRASLQELSQGWDERIEKRRPLEYLVGGVRWRDLLLVVQEGVLIPRTETEQFVDLAKAAVARDDSLRHGIWADIGSGSGAISIAVARMLGPNSGPVVAVDYDDVALEVTRCNISRCQLEGVVKAVKGSWFSPFEGKPEQKLAAVLSNPPYVPSASIPRMRAEACEHEPLYAMDGGNEGMDHLYVVCDGAHKVLRHGGFLALETDGGKQAHNVADYLVKSEVFAQIMVTKDYGALIALLRPIVYETEYARCN